MNQRGGNKIAQLFFYYGTMNSGKSLELLKVAYNYTEQQKKVVLLTSSLDYRTGIGNISSRAGISEEAYPVSPQDNIEEIISKKSPQIKEDDYISCILIDEAQFLTKEHIIQLEKLVEKGIPVLAFGLKNDFSNNLFEGSKELLIRADKLKEIKTICWHPDCGKKAIMNIRLSESGEPIYEGEQVEIGGNERYIPVCRKHYYNYE